MPRLAGADAFLLEAVWDLDVSRMRRALAAGADANLEVLFNVVPQPLRGVIQLNRELALPVFPHDPDEPASLFRFVTRERHPRLDPAEEDAARDNVERRAAELDHRRADAFDALHEFGGELDSEEAGCWCGASWTLAQMSTTT